MKQLLFISFLSTAIIWAVAQPPQLDNINENNSVLRPDTVVAEGTHTTTRERVGLPEDSSKVATKKVAQKKTTSSKRTTASTKSKE